MNSPAQLTRRDFLATTALTGLALASGPVSTLAQAAPQRRFKIAGISKVFQDLDFEKFADAVAEVGWDGIECQVHPKGQVKPERAPDDLPRLAEALKKRGKEIALIGTDIHNAAEPHAEKVLRTAAKLGIQRYRLGTWAYARERPVLDTLKEIQAELRDLVALNKELGLNAGFQNHSNEFHVGVAVWDVWTIIKDLDLKHIGIYFDVSHAIVGAGRSWPVQARMMEPYYTAVIVKDFTVQVANKKWDVQRAALGEGMLDKPFFQSLKQSSYAGPISLHDEYERGVSKEKIAGMQKDLRVLKSWLEA
jgi:sugar phosphate isomerase/epimerase